MRLCLSGEMVTHPLSMTLDVLDVESRKQPGRISGRGSGMVLDDEN
jgi:hypothetical protein